MSRSYRKTPIIGMTTCSSKPSAQKKFRTQENQAKRKKIKQLLHQGQELLPHEKEYGNEWASPRDGKQYLTDDKEYWMRK
jgi:hypothetical protein